METAEGAFLEKKQRSLRARNNIKSIRVRMMRVRLFDKEINLLIKFLRRGAIYVLNLLFEEDVNIYFISRFYFRN